MSRVLKYSSALVLTAVTLLAPRIGKLLDARAHRTEFCSIYVAFWKCWDMK